MRQREAAARKPFEKRLAAIESELQVAPFSGAEAAVAECLLASLEAYEEAQQATPAEATLQTTRLSWPSARELEEDQSDPGPDGGRARQAQMNESG